VALHPGITIEQAKAATGWDLKVATHLSSTKAPTDAELETLRGLHARTAKAHGTVSTE
jgi:glutaconate CoA-transferase subunit B